MEKRIENLLFQVAEIVRQDKWEKEQDGDNFNIFDILNLSADEKKHSAFIAELLNPQGSHNFGDTFLQAFIDTIDCLKDWGFNTARAKIQLELPIGCINNRCTEGGFIDIWIESQDRAIIIENKIYACDQKKQLLRYRNYAEKLVKLKKLSDYRLIYLTLDNREASDYSTDKQLEAGKNYFIIGYPFEILKWLECCAAKSSGNLMVSSAITQYVNLIKNLTHQDMLPENSNRIIDIMTHHENVAAILTIENHLEEWRNQIIERYLIPQLKKWAELNDWKFKEENQGGYGFYFYKEEWKRSAIWIWTDRKRTWKDFYITISSTDGKSLKGLCGQHQIFAEKRDIWDPYGWEFLDKYSDWTNIMEDMVNGKVTNYIIEKVTFVLDEIKRLKLPMP